MSRPRPADLMTLDAVEHELDLALRDLRALEGTSNLQARTATEYRIGRLRRRKAFLEWLPDGAVPSNSIFRRYEVQHP